MPKRVITRPSARDTAELTFDKVAKRRDADLDVLLGALLVARDVYPDIDVLALVGAIDELAAPLFKLRLEELLPDEQATHLSEYLYETAGFSGNESDYYDPKNSLMPDVLRLRRGIPLMLAIVYCEVARRVGVAAKGVAFPGHFLVRIDSRVAGTEPLIIDPFFGGRVLTKSELQARLAKVLGEDASTDLTPHLAVASPRAILVRLLTNLKAIYLTRNERARAHLALDRIVTLLPTAPTPLFERGKLAAILGAHESAKDDFTRALALDPDRGEAGQIRVALANLGTKTTVLN